MNPKPKRPRPARQAANESRRIAAAALKQFPKQKLARPPAATDKSLARIWPAWTALLAAMLPEERATILAGRQLDFGDYRQHYKRLHKSFKGLLPLDEREYHNTLKVAADWTNLMVVARSSIEANRDEIKTQLRYLTFDMERTGWVAAYRTHREISHTRPDLLAAGKCPTLADVDFVCRRHAAYLRAREDAVGLLSKLVFLPGLVSPHDINYENQALGLPQPPPRFPRHIYLARLAAFGVCTRKRLQAFMAEDFLRYTPAGQHAFLHELRRPTTTRGAYKYPFLFIWLAENAPVFNEFKAQWPDIFRAVRARFNPRAPDGYQDCPADAVTLKVLWKEFEASTWPVQWPRIKPPTGAPRKGVRCPLPYNLLTPRPAFRLPAKW